MPDFQGLREALVELMVHQAACTAALADQLLWLAGGAADPMAQVELDALVAQVRTAADTARQQTALIRANSQGIAALVPESLPGKG
jgi:hypothetical protein